MGLSGTLSATSGQIPAISRGPADIEAEQTLEVGKGKGNDARTPGEGWEFLEPERTGPRPTSRAARLGVSAGQQHYEERLLAVQPVFRLIEDN